MNKKLEIDDRLLTTLQKKLDNFAEHKHSEEKVLVWFENGYQTVITIKRPHAFMLNEDGEYETVLYEVG